MSKEDNATVYEIAAALTEKDYPTARAIYRRIVETTGKVSEADRLYGEARRLAAFREPVTA
jgi:alpha/beta superfamily hydrolase